MFLGVVESSDYNPKINQLEIIKPKIVNTLYMQF